jgi:hypothetical protein
LTELLHKRHTRDSVMLMCDNLKQDITMYQIDAYRKLNLLVNHHPW